MADSNQRVFTTEIGGKTFERIASTPSDVIRFQFEGWREITGQAANKTVSAVERDVKAGEKAAAAADKATDAAKK